MPAWCNYHLSNHWLINSRRFVLHLIALGRGSSPLGQSSSQVWQLCVWREGGSCDGTLSKAQLDPWNFGWKKKRFPRTGQIQRRGWISASKLEQWPVLPWMSLWRKRGEQTTGGTGMFFYLYHPLSKLGSECFACRFTWFVCWFPY